MILKWLQVKDKELQTAAKVTPPPSEATRRLCLLRLVLVLERAGKATPPPSADDAKPRRERRGENALLKEAVAFLAEKRDAAVSHSFPQLHMIPACCTNIKPLSQFLDSSRVSSPSLHIIDTSGRMMKAA